jgi:Lrp/AsnC family transcriptional regulator for asnA, asnC and gidA
MKNEIDNTDIKILSMLQDNSRTPFTMIANRLGVSDATIHMRVKKMEKLGVIEQYTITINEEKMGKPIESYVLIRVNPGSVQEICKKLTQLDGIYEVSEIHERYDILVKIKGQNLDEIRDILIDKIRSIPDIMGSEAYTVYKTWKRDLGTKI